MPILKQPGMLGPEHTEQLRKSFEDEIFDLIDERDRQIVRNAIEMIKRCAVEEATNGTTTRHNDR